MAESNLRAGSGVLIRVNDLNTQRIFYREILMLGNSVVDSAFWVEFSAPDGTRIILEKSEAPYLDHNTSATTLVLALPDLEAVRKELLTNNYPLSGDIKPHPGEDFYRGQDPEGNIFYICAQ